MSIYFAHTKKIETEEKLYDEIINNKLNEKFSIILPHKITDKAFRSKELFKSKQCKLVIAEVSELSTSLGIELGWANMLNIPIIMFKKKGSYSSKSLLAVGKKPIEYENSQDFVNLLKEKLSKN